MNKDSRAKTCAVDDICSTSKVSYNKLGRRTEQRYVTRPFYYYKVSKMTTKLLPDQKNKLNSPKNSIRKKFRTFEVLAPTQEQK